MDERAKIKLGKRIRHAREESGITQEEFAKRVGYDRNFWGRLERGLQNPTLTTLIRIAKALEMSIAQLVEGVDR